MIIEAIKEKLTCTELAESRNVLFRDGSKLHFKYRGCQDGSSAYIYPETNSWYCFARGVGGDVIDLAEFIDYGEVSRGRAPSFKQALDALRISLGITVPENKENLTPDELNQLNADALFHTLISQAHEILLADSDAMAVLRDRGISDETIERFKVGYLDSSTGLYSRDILNRTFQDSTLQLCGLYNKDGSYKYQYASNYLFPVYYNGKIVNIVAYRPGGKPKYLHLTKAPFVQFMPFGLDTIPERQGKSVFLCEGIFDALSAYEAGFACIARLGTHMSTSAANAISALCRQTTVKIVTDWDKPNNHGLQAGMDSALRDIDTFMRRQLSVYVIDLKPELFTSTKSGLNDETTASLTTQMNTEDFARIFGMPTGKMERLLLDYGIVIGRNHTVNGYAAAQALTKRGHNSTISIRLDGMLSEYANNLSCEPMELQKLDLNAIWLTVAKDPSVIKSLSESALPAIQLLLAQVSDDGKTRQEFLNAIQGVIKRYPNISEQDLITALQSLGFVPADIKLLLSSSKDKRDEIVTYANLLKETFNVIYCNETGLMFYDDSLGIWERKTSAFWNHLMRTRIVPPTKTISDVWRKAEQEIQALVYTHENKFEDRQERFLVLDNGVYDTINDIFFPDFAPTYYATTRLNITYDKRAEAPNFERFLRDLFVVPRKEKSSEHIAEAHAKISYIKELIGLLMVPDNRLQLFWTFLGSGSNGKSTLENLIVSLLGSRNCSHLSVKQLENRFSLAELQGKLLNTTSEAEAAPSTDSTEIIKRISGNTPLQLERKTVQDQVQDIIRARFIISANKPIRWRDSSHAIARRQENAIVVFPNEFHAGIDEAHDNRRPKDYDMDKKLMNEKSGIFNIAMEGLRSLRQRGKVITLPDGNDVLTETLTSSPVSDFCNLAVVASITNNAVELNEIYNKYKKYASTCIKTRPRYYQSWQGAFNDELVQWLNTHAPHAYIDRNQSAKGRPYCVYGIELLGMSAVIENYNKMYLEEAYSNA